MRYYKRNYFLCASLITSAYVLMPTFDAQASKKTTTSKPTTGEASHKEGKTMTTSETNKATTATSIQTTPSGLQYIDEVVGTGAQPQKGQRVQVHYVGTLKDGTKFDSSRDRNEPFTFVIGVGQVIKGWDEGVMSMRVGGKRKLIIPSALGYGEAGAGGVIPPRAELHFDVELLAVK